MVLAFPKQTIFLKLTANSTLGVLISPGKNSEATWSPWTFLKKMGNTFATVAMGILNQKLGSAVINSGNSSLRSLGILGRIQSRSGNLFYCSFCQFHRFSCSHFNFRQALHWAHSKMKEFFLISARKEFKVKILWSIKSWWSTIPIWALDFSSWYVWRI